MESGDHRVTAPDDAGLTGVEPVEEGREADASGHGVEFRQRKAVLGQQQVGPQHGRQDAAVARIAGMGDERGGFAAVEVFGHPRRQQGLVAQEVAAARGTEVKGLQGLVKFQASRADGRQFLGLFRRDRPGRG